MLMTTTLPCPLPSRCVISLYGLPVAMLTMMTLPYALHSQCVILLHGLPGAMLMKTTFAMSPSQIVYDFMVHNTKDDDWAMSPP